MRDENGFKQHCLSESHVRLMLTVGNKDFQDYTKQFVKDFIQLLRTSHGEKSVHINGFYQTYIANKVSSHTSLLQTRLVTDRNLF